MATYEVRLSGDRKAIIHGATRRPPHLFTSTDSPQEALGALDLHDRCRCYNKRGDIVPREELLKAAQAQRRSAREAAEETQRIQEGTAGKSLQVDVTNLTPEEQAKANEAKDILAWAEAQAEATLEDAGAQAERIVEEAKAEASRIAEGAKAEVARLIEEANTEAERIVANAKAEAQHLTEQEAAAGQTDDANQPTKAASPQTEEGAQQQTAETTETNGAQPQEAPQEDATPADKIVLREDESFPPFNAGADKLTAFAASYEISDEDLWADRGYSEAYNWLKSCFQLD